MAEPDEAFEELIERSSLGTPVPRQLRRRTSRLENTGRSGDSVRSTGVKVGPACWRTDISSTSSAVGRAR
jgi:hypothetical protein